ncbi:MAG: substrate-binding domain-containing protein [Pseudomonadota bacterium]
MTHSAVARFAILVVTGLAVLGCAQKQAPPAPLRLATTTSVDNTGLLQVLLPPFEQRTGLQVQVMAVGTGQALALAARGDVDAVLVHAPEAEAAFMAEGHGTDRRTLMKNDFVLLGPSTDPAGLRGGSDAAAALKIIADKQAVFVSRGDKSGTHMKEQALWQQAGITPQGAWYLEAGQGMRMTLGVASEKQAYCLSDRATYDTAASQLQLEVLVQGDPRLDNLYSVMAVDPVKHPGVNHVAALALVAWLSSKTGLELIAGFQPQKKPLFHLVSGCDPVKKSGSTEPAAASAPSMP